MEHQLDINVMPAISWEEAATCISGGTVESLSGLRRSEAGLKSYRAFKEQASKPQLNSSVPDFQNAPSCIASSEFMVLYCLVLSCMMHDAAGAAGVGDRAGPHQAAAV